MRRFGLFLGLTRLGYSGSYFMNVGFVGECPEDGVARFEYLMIVRRVCEKKVWLMVGSTYRFEFGRRFSEGTNFFYRKHFGA